jgi:hypothetical protein
LPAPLQGYIDCNVMFSDCLPVPYIDDQGNDPPRYANACRAHPADGELGQPCMGEADCESYYCYTSVSYPGFCSARCRGDFDCLPWTVCRMENQAGYICEPPDYKRPAR